jgi:hypothetical protein
MTTLKIRKIPDRIPVKISLNLPPEVYRDLIKYAEIYKQEHGSVETPQLLASQMIAIFMQNDSGFKRAKLSSSET